MSNKTMYDFAMFSNANKGKDVSGFDYLHAVYQSQGLTPDFVLWFSRLFSPEFKVVGGQIYISVLYSQEIYNELLKEGHEHSQVQFWMNLLEITGLFNDLSIEQAMEFAQMVVNSWNFKLNKEFNELTAKARMIYDEDSEEVFVTIDASDENA
ncbi:hypothetical protein WB527_004139 [Vibrio vulnificus]